MNEGRLQPELLAILRCPATKQPLRWATAAELAAMPGKLGEALIREDGQVAYPVHNGIPLLIADAAINVTAAAQA